MDASMQRFGGDWTERKLEKLDKYLIAYLNVFKNQDWCCKLYIDAFAGTGYRKEKDVGKIEDGGLFGIDLENSEEDESYRDGSAAIALRRDPGFDEYHFIEIDSVKCQELEKLKDQYTGKQIHCHNAEANEAIQALCKNGRAYWSKRRAVLFLDPFGMTVRWETLQAVAETGTIDVWILFPISSGVARLLENKGNISSGREARLTAMFGTDEWRTAFYQKKVRATLFGMGEDLVKNADYGKIADFFITRLRSIFPHVAPDPLFLYNSKNNPLFGLCFASANSGKGGELAVKIASKIIGG